MDRFELALSGLGLDAKRLSLKKHPDGIHWHIRQPGTTGTLEATYVPDGQRLWLESRPGRTADWQEPIIDELRVRFA